MTDRELKHSVHNLKQWRELEEAVFSDAEHLQRLQRYAWTHHVGPMALLAAVITRINASVPTSATLDSGSGDGGFNTFAAFVGPSGAGKDKTINAMEEAVNITGNTGHPISVPQHGMSSGEGIVSLFAYREERRTADGEEVEQPPQLESVLLIETEVSELGRKAERSGATLRPTLLKVYSGGALGGVTKAERTNVEAGSYRAGLIVGVQPGNAGLILSDATSGFPQRFLWTEMVGPPEESFEPRDKPINVELKIGPGDTMDCCKEIKEATRKRNLDRLYGDFEGIESHTHLTTIRVAAGIALLREHTIVEADDWDRAQALMAYSRKVRQACEKAALEEQARGIEERNGIEDAAHQKQLAKLREKIVTALEGDRVPVGGAMTEREITRNWSPRQREKFRDAIDELIDPDGTSGGSPARVRTVSERNDKGEYVVKYKLAPA